MRVLAGDLTFGAAMIAAVVGVLSAPTEVALGIITAVALLGVIACR